MNGLMRRRLLVGVLLEAVVAVGVAAPNDVEPTLPAPMAQPLVAPAWRERGLGPFSPWRRWALPDAAYGASPPLPTAPDWQTQPLSTMRYVGRLEKTSSRAEARAGSRRRAVALLSINGVVHAIRVGQVLGLEAARVVAITDEAVELQLSIADDEPLELRPRLRWRDAGQEGD